MRAVSLLAVLCFAASVSAAPRRRAALTPPRAVPLIEAPQPATVAPPKEPTTTVMVTEKRRWDLFGGGLALFLVGWAADIGVSYGVPNNGAAHSFIPLVGPLVQMGDKFALEVPPPTGNPAVDAEVRTRASEVNNTIQNVAYVVLAFDFALQLAGVTMAIVGAATKSRSISYERTPPPLGRSSVQWSIVPGTNGGSTIALRF